MRAFRELRLIPVVLLATVCLLALKILGVLVDGVPVLAIEEDAQRGRATAASERTEGAREAIAAAPGGSARPSWASAMFNFPDVTGSVQSKPADKPGEKAGDKPADKPGVVMPPPAGPGGKVVFPAAPTAAVPPGERALLERLQERRQELEARARELEVRENLLRSAEKQLDSRLGEIKAMEDSLKVAVDAKDDAEAKRFKGLVTMYENMRAKDAAKIFDRLELKVLLDVASHLNPRRMSDILAQMLPENAERLTVELAARANSTVRTPTADELPKIEGRPRAP